MKASFIVLTLLAALLVGGCAVNLGVSPTPTQAPPTATATPEPYLRLSDEELLQVASLREAPPNEPVDWGPYRVVPSDHPEWAAHMATVYQPRTPEGQAWAEAWQRNRVITWPDARSRIPGGLREPRWLPSALLELQISGNIGPDDSYSIRLQYGKPREGGEKPGEPGTAFISVVEVVQQSMFPSFRKETPLFTENRNTRTTTTQLGFIQGQPAVFYLPRADIPQTNPKSVYFVKNGIRFCVSQGASLDMDLATLIRIAESIP